jgi:hypothetical protein
MTRFNLSNRRFAPKACSIVLMRGARPTVSREASIPYGLCALHHTVAVQITTFRRPIPASRQLESVAILQPFDLVVPGRIDSEAKVQKKTG